MQKIESPYLLYLGDVKDPLAAKTAQGIAKWRKDLCLAQCSMPASEVELADIQKLGIEEAAEAGAQTFVIGLANPGGVFPEEWLEDSVKAASLGLNIASGMHVRLQSIPEIAEAREKYGINLFDARFFDGTLKVGTGEKRSGKRLLTVGTDCSTGKMYSALAIAEALNRQKADVTFRATGQTGILIEGEGIPIDAIVSDFIAGAVEQLSPANDPDHWDIIEGQGSLYHPSYAGVSLGLLHGAQPDALVLCHEPTRPHMRNRPNMQVPDLKKCLDLNLELARLTNPEVKAVGVCVNTSLMESERVAEAYLAEVESELSLPCVDPCVQGVERIVGGLS